MSEIQNHKKYTLVTAILPKETAKVILNKALQVKISTNVIINARGTLYKDKLYQKFTPSINPEQRIFELLVPQNQAHVVMDNISVAAGLHEGKRGAIFSTKCEHADFLNDNILPDSLSINKSTDDIIHYKNHLTGIYCIIQKGKADKVATAAIRAGSSGPTIVYGQGHGVRDKLGLLRIAISPEKELIRVVVDHYDTEPVFEAMIKAGNLETPGMGIIYHLQVEKGIINLAAVATGRYEIASRHQMIKAIDELKGSSAWRIQDESEKINKRRFLTNLIRLNCVVEKGKGDTLMRSAMHAGAPGASITYGLEGGGIVHKQNSSLNVYREMEIIEFIMRPEQYEPVLNALKTTAREDGNPDVYFYSVSVPKALTFIN